MPGDDSLTKLDDLACPAGEEPTPEPASKSQPLSAMTLGAAVADLAPKLAPNGLAHTRIRQDSLIQLRALPP